ncbi:RNA 2',3'-cyclic phosphodiesterase [Candidatus Micrarchaeota archaeon]|nr:RNA 2',3'-cyclic phosphodiesterase [Candidatus Micrarchaeota archaeon]
MRCFLAVELNKETRDALAQVIAEAKRSGVQATFVDPQKLHITLLFFGELTEEQAREKIAAIKKICSGVKPFELVVKGLGFLPNERFVRVFHAESFSSELFELQDKLASALNMREERGFKGHVTLARVKTQENLAPLRGLKEKHSETVFGKTLVRELAFKKSILTPKGPEYENVELMKLG